VLRMLTPARRSCFFLFFFLLEYPGFGETPEPEKKLPACSESKPKEDCQILIKPSAPGNGGTYRVRNGTRVTVRVEPISPFEKCSLAVKDRQPIVEENAFEAFLAAIAQAGVPIALLRTPSGKQASARVKAGTQIAATSDINILLRTIEDLENKASAQLRDQYEKVRQFGDRIAALRQNPSLNKKELSDMKEAFHAARKKIIKDIDAFLGTAPPDVSLVSAQITEVTKQINDHLADIVNSDPDLLAQLYQTISDARATLGQLNTGLSDLKNAETKLYAQRDFLETLPDKFSVEFPQYSDTNSVVKQEVSCVDRQSREPAAMGTITYTIEFRDLPRAAVSLGILLSMLDKREIGAADIKDPGSANGFKTVFSETDRAGLQIIPFSFLNVRLWNFWLRGRDIVLSACEGFGINPNNGGKDPEFFSGISFGIKDFFVQIGAHHGRWQELGGGFSLGDTVPDKLDKILVSRRYTTHFAFGLSYHIPPK